LGFMLHPNLRNTDLLQFFAGGGRVYVLTG
jgi:hypothetical protein